VVAETALPDGYLIVKSLNSLSKQTILDKSDLESMVFEGVANRERYSELLDDHRSRR